MAQGRIAPTTAFISIPPASTIGFAQPNPNSWRLDGRPNLVKTPLRSVRVSIRGCQASPV